MSEGSLLHCIIGIGSSALGGGGDGRGDGGGSGSSGAGGGWSRLEEQPRVIVRVLVRLVLAGDSYLPAAA